MLQQKTNWLPLNQYAHLCSHRLKDPLPYMARYPEAQVLTSSDHLVSARLAKSSLTPLSKTETTGSILPACLLMPSKCQVTEAVAGLHGLGDWGCGLTPLPGTQQAAHCCGWVSTDEHGE